MNCSKCNDKGIYYEKCAPCSGQGYMMNGDLCNKCYGKGESNLFTACGCGIHYSKKTKHGSNKAKIDERGAQVLGAVAGIGFFAYLFSKSNKNYISILWLAFLAMVIFGDFERDPLASYKCRVFPESSSLLGIIGKDYRKLNEEGKCVLGAYHAAYLEALERAKDYSRNPDYYVDNWDKSQRKVFERDIKVPLRLKHLNIISSKYKHLNSGITKEDGGKMIDHILLISFNYIKKNRLILKPSFMR